MRSNPIQYFRRLQIKREVILQEVKRWDLTPKDISLLCNLSVVTISNFLSGATWLPSDRTMDELYRAVGISVFVVQNGTAKTLVVPNDKDEIRKVANR